MKILARVLLRLFPRDFRQEYGEEWLDLAARRGAVSLVTDTVKSLPMVWSLRSRPGPLGDESGASFLETLLQDFRFGLRTLRRRPLFAAVAVGTLGLGIGAATAMFSVVQGVLLRPLPFHRPGELVQIYETYPEWRENPQLTDGWDRVYLAWPDYERLRDGQTVYESVAIYGSIARTLNDPGEPTRVSVGVASASLLPTLGVTPSLGRSFTTGEDGPGGARVALLSHEVWRDRFGADPSALGGTIRLDTTVFSVIGVLPPRFHVRGLGLFGGSGEAAVWIPVGSDGRRLTAGSHSYDGVARLKPKVALDRATDETAVLLRGDRPPSEMGARLVRREEAEIAGLGAPLLLLLGASLVLLLIGCGNVATLHVGEMTTRRHEMATRAALGAGRGRLVRQLATESVVLGLAGSALGLLLAEVGTRALITLAPPIPRLDEVGVNGTVLGFAMATGLATGLAFGLAPVLGLTWTRLRLGLGRTGERRSSLFQWSVITAEVGLTVVLLVSGGLLARSLGNLLTGDPGFDPQELAATTVLLPAHRYPPGAERIDVFRRMEEAIRAVPGVESVTGTSSLPFHGFPSLVSFGILGQELPEGAVSPHTSDRNVLPGYFQAMGIPLLAGRVLAPGDESDPSRPAIISESMAQRFWPGESPLGAQVDFGDTLTVVGIVGDVRHESMEADLLPTLYTPFARDPWTRITFVVKSASDSDMLFPLLRSAVRSVDPEAPVTLTSTLDDLIAGAARTGRFRTALLLTFGLFATLLAGGGVFGVTARTVAHRRREMGVRRALGAEEDGLVGLVLRGTLGAGVAGVALGLVMAFWISRLLQGFLFQVPPWDPPTYAAVATLLLAISTLSAWVPARRAARVDPMEVLRPE